MRFAATPVSWVSKSQRMPTPLAKDQGTSELQDCVLLETREQVRVGRLHRQGRPSKVCVLSHLRIAQQELVLLGNILYPGFGLNRSGG